MGWVGVFRPSIAVLCPLFVLACLVVVCVRFLQFPHTASSPRQNNSLLELNTGATPVRNRRTRTVLCLRASALLVKTFEEEPMVRIWSDCVRTCQCFEFGWWSVDTVVQGRRSETA